VKRAIRRATLAGCEPAIEQTIWRAATYTQGKLLQRSPTARYQTAVLFDMELKRADDTATA
jgi:hypothetical protein